MHGAINTRNRYVECPTCKRAAAFDMVTGKCTVTSCPDYFAAPASPRPPSTREVVEAERAVLKAAQVWLIWHSDQVNPALERGYRRAGVELRKAVTGLNTVLARNSGVESDAFSRQHDR